MTNEDSDDNSKDPNEERDKKYITVDFNCLSNDASDEESRIDYDRLSPCCH